MLGTRLFEATAPSAGNDDIASVKALNAAFGTAVAERGTWVAQPMPPGPVRAPAL